MRLPIRFFVNLSPMMIRLLAGPICNSTDDICLITMKECSELWHAAHASDGRIYDALALRFWLKSQLNQYVIKGCPIDFVNVLPMPYTILFSVIHTVVSRWSALQKNLKLWLRRHSQTKRKQAPKSMFIRVVEYHKLTKHKSLLQFQGRRAFRHGKSSPFVQIEHQGAANARNGAGCVTMIGANRAMGGC